MKAVVLAATLCALPAGAGPISFGDLANLPKADIVVLGEVHDNKEHHANQARAVAAIAPRALVFEMLLPEQAAQMPDDRSDAGRLAASLRWDTAGWPDFAMYHPIFTAAPLSRVYGADVARDVVRKAVDHGAVVAFGADAGRYGLDKSLRAADQAAREAEQAAAHCSALPVEMLPGMVQAQRLRDAVLARTAETALRETGGPVVVITGTAHARRDTGVAAALAQADLHLRVLSVGQLESDPGIDPPYDLWLITAPMQRPDPCLAFRG